MAESKTRNKRKSKGAALLVKPRDALLSHCQGSTPVTLAPLYRYTFGNVAPHFAETTILSAHSLGRIVTSIGVSEMTTNICLCHTATAIGIFENSMQPVAQSQR